MITGELRAAERRVRLQRIASGDAALVVGTHALLEASVEFERLRVIVVDEQHRFGVEQRAALSEGHGAHALHMTATPIPRSLALSLYGDLDLTELRELPAGQAADHHAPRARRQARRLLPLARSSSGSEHGRQAYVVCPLVEGSETVQARAAEDLHAELVEALAPLTVGLVHGRQKSAERAATMRAFAAAEVQVLVATTVIEVGIDVPNATAMVIEDADRFGLSQLHQLRGRVGRGSDQSYCFLFESSEPSELGQRRLEALCKHASGFELAELDLRMRGEGELSGVRQSGASDLRHASLSRHRRLIARSRADARLPGRARARRRGARAGRARALRRAGRARSGAHEDRRRRARRARACARRKGGACGRPPSACARRSSTASAPLAGGAALDLFAGSGALGLEALSRGAATVPVRRRLARGDRVRARERRRARRSRSARACAAADFQRVLRDEARAGARYDLVLLDPPYAAAEGYAAALGELVPAVLAPGALIVIESARGLDLALDLPADPPRRYGASTIQIIRNGP